MYELPVSIFTKDGEEYKIRNNGDYRMVLDCLEALEDQNLKPLERLYAGLIIFYQDLNDIDDIHNLGDEIGSELVTQMTRFFNLNEDPDESQKSKPKLIDWQKDSNLIISAINKVAGKEIRNETYLHWWTFISYYMAIGESSLSTIISIREKIARNKSLEKYEKEYISNNPRYFEMDFRSAEQKADDEWLQSVWNSGKG